MPVRSSVLQHRRLLGPTASVALVTLFAATLFALASPIAHAAPTCTTSTAPAGYSVTVCISAPAGGATLSGSQTVTGTVSVTGTNPGVQRMVFYLDNIYLLTDYESPYTFSISTQKWVDGSHVIGLETLIPRSGTELPTWRSGSIGIHPQKWLVVRRRATDGTPR